ncbi:MAG: hypothetical protein AB3N20_00250 [Rhizobiaceae bacterium]
MLQTFREVVGSDCPVTLEKATLRHLRNEFCFDVLAIENGHVDLATEPSPVGLPDPDILKIYSEDLE